MVWEAARLADSLSPPRVRAVRVTFSRRTEGADRTTTVPVNSQEPAAVAFGARLPVAVPANDHDPAAEA